MVWMNIRNAPRPDGQKVGIRVRLRCKAVR